MVMSGENDRVGELIHDIRNKLAIVRANVEAFIDGKLAASAERFGAVLQALEQADVLVKDLRAESMTAASSVHIEPIDLCALLSREYASIEAVAIGKHLTLQIDRCPTPHAACAHFFGDPVRIGQIVSNLLLNAVRYTPPGGSVDVRCGRRGDEIEIAIADTGPGVRADESSQIFQRGYRGDAARGTAGSGHGLAIVKANVESLGGSVRVAELAEGGATFVVRLPGSGVDPRTSSPPCEHCSSPDRSQGRPT